MKLYKSLTQDWVTIGVLLIAYPALLRKSGYEVPKVIIHHYKDMGKLSETQSSLIRVFNRATTVLGGMILGRILSHYYHSIRKMVFLNHLNHMNDYYNARLLWKDIEVGGEFNAAVDEARKWKIPVLLGDRDIDVTLQRLLCALCGQDSLR